MTFNMEAINNDNHNGNIKVGTITNDKYNKKHDNGTMIIVITITMTHLLIQ